MAAVDVQRNQQLLSNPHLNGVEMVFSALVLCGVVGLAVNSVSDVADYDVQFGRLTSSGQRSVAALTQVGRGI
jgi:hypothetical protein